MALRCPDTRECGTAQQFHTREAKAVVVDPFDVALEDSDLLVEVEMTTSLIIAASASEGPLPLDEIDRILGVDRDEDVA